MRSLFDCHSRAQVRPDLGNRVETMLRELATEAQGAGSLSLHSSVESGLHELSRRASELLLWIRLR
jgi:hypothetical protein